MRSSPSRAASAPTTSSPGSRRAPTASPTAGSTSAGSVTAVSGTKTAPPDRSASIACAASSARRVFPMPPGPVRVTSRVRLSRSSATTVAMSSSRPMQLPGGVGTCHRRPSVCRGGKSTGRPATTSWYSRAGPSKSFSRCSPRSRRVAPSGSVVAHQGRRGLGQQDLAAVARRRRSGRRGAPPGSRSSRRPQRPHRCAGPSAPGRRSPGARVARPAPAAPSTAAATACARPANATKNESPCVSTSRPPWAAKPPAAAAGAARAARRTRHRPRAAASSSPRYR